MAPRWLDGLADVLAEHRRPVLRRDRGAGRAGHRLPRAPRRPGVARAHAAARPGRGARRRPDRAGARGHRRPHQRRRDLPPRRRPRRRRRAARRRAAPTRSTGGRSRSAWAPSSRAVDPPATTGTTPCPAVGPRVHDRRADPRRRRLPVEEAVAGVDRLALVLGSEGHGLSRAGSGRDPAPIPMAPASTRSTSRPRAPWRATSPTALAMPGHSATGHAGRGSRLADRERLHLLHHRVHLRRRLLGSRPHVRPPRR